MPHFLIHYDHSTGKAFKVQEFKDRAKAEEEWKKAGQENAWSKTIEVSLIEARDRKTLEKKWRRYFHRPVPGLRQGVS
jgi:hypothetical protein